MYKLFINDMFIENIDGFQEAIDSMGDLKFLVNQPIANTVDTVNLETKLVGLKPYFEPDSIEKITILTEDDSVLLESFVFSKIEQADLDFNFNGPDFFNIILA